MPLKKCTALLDKGQCPEKATYKCTEEDEDGSVWYRCAKHRCEHCKLMTKVKE